MAKTVIVRRFEIRLVLRTGSGSTREAYDSMSAVQPNERLYVSGEEVKREELTRIDV